MAEWEAYSMLEPFGWDSDNLLAAGIRNSVYAVNMKKPPKIDELMFDFIKPNKAVGPKAFMDFMKAMAKRTKK